MPGMHLTGTMLAPKPRMNDRSRAPAPPPTSPRCAAEAPAEEEPRRDDRGAEELDKYDISTLACTD